jgi:histidinol phosphatase-like enzyme (inositol monophosphatase family)
MEPSFGATPVVAVSAEQKDEYLQFAKGAARLAGEIILPHFRSGIRAKNKQSGRGFDPVTVADQGAEEAIRGAIESVYPEHGIFGEEFGYKGGNGLTWVIDPIDGTRAFISGMLHWGVLLALFDGENPIVGVMYQPYTDELFFGDGESAWMQRGQIITQLISSRCATLDNAIMTTTGTSWFSTQQRLEYRQLQKNVRLHKVGGDCYLFGMLAMGQIDLGLEGSLKAYDIQALIPIVRGAGGVITTWKGENPSMGGDIVAAANADLHKQALTMLNLSAQR